MWQPTFWWLPNLGVMFSALMNKSNFVPEKVLRRILLHYFNMKKTAPKSLHRILVERTCQKWCTRFESGDFGMEYEERSIWRWGTGRSMKNVAEQKTSSQNILCHSINHFKTFESNRIHSKLIKRYKKKTFLQQTTLTQKNHRFNTTNQPNQRQNLISMTPR